MELIVIQENNTFNESIAQCHDTFRLPTIDEFIKYNGENLPDGVYWSSTIHEDSNLVFVYNSADQTVDCLNRYLRADMAIIE